VGVITSSPACLTFANDQSIAIDYVDNLTIKKGSRKIGIAPILIQTHIYNTRRLNGSTAVCLFKREGELTAIVPLTIYDTATYNFKQFPSLKINDSCTTLIKITKSNFHLFKDMIKLVVPKYECTVNIDITTVYSLIMSGNLIIYSLAYNNAIIASYIFRQCPCIVYESIYSIELLASVKNTSSSELFFKGFISACRRIERKYNISRVHINLVSDSGIITKQLQDNKIENVASCPTALYLYNYAHYSVSADKCLFIY
jgi:hypothetical protein